MTDKLHYTYKKITELIKNKADEIKSYNPDIVIAIGGGGLIPSRIARNFLKKPIYVVTLSLYDNEYIKNKIDTIQWINLDLKDKKVLLIDEIDDTRKTLDFCVKKLRTENKANDICVFVLHNKVKPKLGCLENINYISCENIEDRWVVYPWDVL